MKIFLFAVFMAVGVGRCNSFTLQEINKDMIGLLQDDYIAKIFEKDDQKTQYLDESNVLKANIILWDAVEVGMKKILLATDKDRAYAGHIFFSRKKDGCICLEIPGYSDHRIMPSLFKAFIHYARRIDGRRNNLVFDLLSGSYQNLMKDFGFVESQSIDSRLQRFILTTSKKLKKLNKKKINDGYYNNERQ